MTYDIRRLAHPRKRLIVHYNRLKPFLQASPHGEQESSEEEEEKGTPSEEQESRGEEINKQPQESMADLQDEQYIYVETRRPEPGPAVEEYVPPPPLFPAAHLSASQITFVLLVSESLLRFVLYLGVK